MADYILLANPDKIYPEQFRSPYVIHDEQSLDELMDNVETADIVEAFCTSITQAKHAPSKRKIDRNNPTHAAIPGMTELWNTIDNVRESASTYVQKRLLIDLYKQQYTLLEAYSPNIPHYSHATHNHADESIPDEYYEKLCSPQYMAKFLIYLPHLNSSLELQELVELVQQSISLADLTPLQQYILSCYQNNAPTQQTLSNIYTFFGRKISQPYLSNVLYKQIAPRVSTEYSELYHRQIWADDPTKWRTCICCKQKKLLTKHNWYHFSNKPQGFSLVCKECTKLNKMNKNK